MSLIERVTDFMNFEDEIKKDYDFVFNILYFNKEIHISHSDKYRKFNEFLELADGKEIHFKEMDDSIIFVYEAFFYANDIRFVVLLQDGQREELEDLIKEREAEALANE